MQVDGGDDAHVGLAPLAAAVGHLRLEELERVQPQGVLRDLEQAAQDGGGLVLHEEEGAVGFALGDLLEEAQVRDGGVEEAGGIGGERGGREGGGGMAERVDFWGAGGWWWGG